MAPAAQVGRGAAHVRAAIRGAGARAAALSGGALQVLASRDAHAVAAKLVGAQVRFRHASGTHWFMRHS